MLRTAQHRTAQHPAVQYRTTVALFMCSVLASGFCLAQNGLVWGKDTTPPDPTWTKPPLYQSRQDPAYGSTVRRMTSAAGTRFDRNTYSRRQAENSNGTFFLTYHGDAVYNVYDRSTGALVRSFGAIHPDGDPQWHPTDPYKLRHLAGSDSYSGELALYESDVRGGPPVKIADLSSRIKAIFPTADYILDRAEGSPSADGDRYAWLVKNDQEDNLGLVTYDLGDDSILGSLALPRPGPSRGDLDWVSISPTGSYVVASWWYGTYSYDADLDAGSERLLLDGAEHSDIALDAQGRDTYVVINFSSGALEAIDLATGAKIELFNLFTEQTNTSIHISGKAYRVPGWVLVSTYSCKTAPPGWACHKVFAVELVQNPRILNLAHTYNCGDDYWTEPHAVPNRAFTRVYFNSDAGSCGIDAEVYQVEVNAFGEVFSDGFESGDLTAWS